MGAGLHFTALQVALALPQALPDDMLGGLGGDAAEFLGFQLGDHLLANLIGFAHLLGVLQTDLREGVLHFLHDVAEQAGAEGADLGVDVHHHVFVLHVVVLLHGDDDGRLDLFDQVVRRQAALLFQSGKGLKKFVVCSCHFDGFLPVG